MQDGEYIVDRWMVKMLRALCEQRGIIFSAHSDDWLLEMKMGSRVHRVLGYRFDLNNSVAAHISQDKVASYQVLTNAHISAVPHVLVRTKVSHANKQAMSGWSQVVIKPLNGAGGHGVKLFSDTNEAAEYIEHSSLAGWAATPFIDIKREIRIIMLDGAPLLSYEKLPVVVQGLKMFNLGLGATPKDTVVSNELIELAANAQSELGLRLSTVDIVEDEEGHYRVLEINDSIMMEYYARFSAENKQRAQEIYSKIVDAVMENAS